MTDAALQHVSRSRHRTALLLGLVVVGRLLSELLGDVADEFKRDQGIDLPVHVGIAGPAKLQTLIKFAAACGVGPSLGVLQKRAKDVRKLVMPFEPMEVVRDLAAARARDPRTAPAQVHFFPLGGIGHTIAISTDAVLGSSQKYPGV